MSTLVPLSSNSRGQVSSSPAGVTSWPLVAGDGAAGCARNPTGYVTAATSATIHDDINPRRRVRGPGLQDVVGRVPSRGGTFGVMYKRKELDRFDIFMVRCIEVMVSMRVC